MDIKNFLYKKEEKKAKNIWVIVTIIIILLFIVAIVYLNKNDYNSLTEHFIWEQISISGEIFYDNNYPTNTHKLVNDSESFWIKESKTNLNKFVDTDVLIEGNINEITVKYPILTISKLKIPQYGLSISENKYFYTKDLISFDFSKDTDLYSKKIAGQIVIYYKDEPMLYVDTFVCSNVTEIQNCEKMKMNYIVDLAEIFESTLWYTFYRNKEDSRVAFNDDNVWYIFTVYNDEDLLNLSHFIHIVDSKFLLTNKKELILSGCSNDDIKMIKISEIKKWILDDNLIKISVSWTDENKNKISCKLNIDIFNDWDIVNSSISFSE